MPDHLPNENYITYNAHADMSEIASQEFLCRTMLTEWFVANQKYPGAKNLCYCDFPSKWRWNEQGRAWEKRRRDTGKIGHLYFVHPSADERYYLRMLLLTVKGDESYESLRAYNNTVYATFKEACGARGLLSNDQEWYNAFDKATHWAASNQLRQLFVTMLLFCEVGDEHMFFEKVWRLLVDDIQYNMQQTLNHPTYEMSDGDMRDHLLDTLGALFNRRGSNINDFNLPKKSVITSSNFTNSLFDEELSYDHSTLLEESKNMILQLNNEQRHTFDCITDAVLLNKPAFFLFLVMEAQERLFSGRQ
jgi:hypothetical protein